MVELSHLNVDYLGNGNLYDDHDLQPLPFLDWGDLSGRGRTSQPSAVTCQRGEPVHFELLRASAVCKWDDVLEFDYNNLAGLLQNPLDDVLDYSFPHGGGGARLRALPGCQPSGDSGCISCTGGGDGAHANDASRKNQLAESGVPSRLIDRLETYFDSLQRQQDSDRGPEGRWAVARVHQRLQDGLDALDTLLEIVGRRLVSRGFWPIQRVPSSSTVRMNMWSWALHLQSIANELLAEHAQTPLSNTEVVPSPQFLPESVSSEPTVRSANSTDHADIASSSVEAEGECQQISTSSSSGGTSSGRDRSRSPATRSSQHDDGGGVGSIGIEQEDELGSSMSTPIVIDEWLREQVRCALDGQLLGVWAEPASGASSSSAGSGSTTSTTSTTRTLWAAGSEEEMHNIGLSLAQWDSVVHCWGGPTSSSTSTSTSTRTQADVVRDVVNQALMHGGLVDVSDLIRRLLALEEAITWIQHPYQALPLNAAEFERVIFDCVSQLAAEGSASSSSSELPHPDNSLAVLLQPGFPETVEAVNEALPDYDPHIIAGLRRRAWQEHLRRLGFPATSRPPPVGYDRALYLVQSSVTRLALPIADACEYVVQLLVYMLLILHYHYKLPVDELAVLTVVVISVLLFQDLVLYLAPYLVVYLVVFLGKYKEWLGIAVVSSPLESFLGRFLLTLRPLVDAVFQYPTMPVPPVSAVGAVMTLFDIACAVMLWPVVPIGDFYTIHQFMCKLSEPTLDRAAEKGDAQKNLLVELGLAYSGLEGFSVALGCFDEAASVGQAQLGTQMPGALGQSQLKNLLDIAADTPRPLGSPTNSGYLSPQAWSCPASSPKARAASTRASELSRPGPEYRGPQLEPPDVPITLPFAMGLVHYFQHHRNVPLPARYLCRLLDDAEKILQERDKDGPVRKLALRTGVHRRPNEAESQLIIVGVTEYGSKTNCSSRGELFSDPCCWRPVPTRTWATIAAPMPASLGGHVGVARLLLDAGADRNLANSNGDTALKLASVGGHVGVARLLLDDGPYIVNSYGDTTLMAASATGHVEVAPLLYGDTALMAASAKGNVEVARLLLDAGADSNLANSHGRTALNLAFVGGHVQVKRLLLEDLHGQLNDLLWIFFKVGMPSPTNWFLVNGDVCDRGENAGASICFSTWRCSPCPGT
ncbi:ANKRD17 [Symbiodinium sp. KB8]|nr:ANKRD17 [Symbiodinium sp. KB8]